MTFTEAVQTLAEGRCETIEWNMGNTAKFAIDKSCLNDCWQLVGEKPDVEEVEVVRWLCKHGHIQYNGTGLDKSYDTPPKICGYSDEDSHCNTKEFVKLIGKVTRPKPKKVKRREEILINPYTLMNMAENKYVAISSKARFYAEWEEEQSMICNECGNDISVVSHKSWCSNYKYWEEEQ